MIEGPFAAQEGNTGVTQNSRETLINMYAEPQNTGRWKMVRRQRPGVRQVADKVGLKRAIEEFSHGHYMVIGDQFCKWDGTTLTVLGTIDTKIGPITMISDDNDNMFLSDGTTGYHYNATTAAFTQPTMPTDVGTVAFQGGFGIYAEPDADQFYVSAVNDLTSWDALDFATAEGSSDKTLRVYVVHNEVWFFGSKSVEIWRNVGAQDFPFAPNTQMERGCLAAFSIASEDNSVFWLGDDGIVYRADGYRPARVSTHAIEEWIRQAPDPSEAQAFVYTTRGHKFYVLTFPAYGTRQFNIATGLWNACSTWGYDEWKVVGGTSRTSAYYLSPGGIAVLDEDVNTDAGDVLERGGISAPVFNGGERMTLGALWLDCEVGRVAEGETEPQILLQISRNGEEFGNVRARGMGLTGDYARRIMWRNLGQAREFSAKLTCTDDVRLTIMGVMGDLA